MRPVVTAAEMRAADEAAIAHTSHDALVARAGLAAAVGATRLLATVYGARAIVLCGPGSNGADGRVCADHLSRRGAAVEVIDAAEAPARLPVCDLVVDAAFGTGLSRRWDAPAVDGDPAVLAVDLPSGVDPDTGAAAGRTLRATRTVAMGAMKRGHLLADGAAASGSVEVAPIGIDVASASAALVEDADCASLPALARDDHKWRRAVLVVAGSSSLPGAAALCSAGALAAQAGMVLVAMAGLRADHRATLPTEAVRVDGDPDAVLAALRRVHAVVIGPGIGRDGVARELVAVALSADVPVLLDADALHLVRPAALRDRRGGAVVLTPHDGEHAALLGERPGADRFAAASALAERTGSTALLKGATTVVASTGDGVPPLLAVTSGTPDLATPGTGDVLSGVLGAYLARGLAAPLAAALAAHVHGRAGSALGTRCRAGLLPGAVAAVRARLERADDGSGDDGG